MQLFLFQILVANREAGSVVEESDAGVLADARWEDGVYAARTVQMASEVWAQVYVQSAILVVCAVRQVLVSTLSQRWKYLREVTRHRRGADKSAIGRARQYS